MSSGVVAPRAHWDPEDAFAAYFASIPGPRGAPDTDRNHCCAPGDVLLRNMTDNAGHD